MPEKEYIEREALIARLQKVVVTNDTFGMGVQCGTENAIYCIMEQPTADVAEVKHGYWIKHFDDLFPAESTQECSVCHEEEDITLCNDNFCPNCGAKMDGGK